MTVSQRDWQLTDWLSYLEQIHPTSIDMGLERVAQVAQRLAFDWRHYQVITVGGTNGKGTTCRLIEQLLLAQGKTVAVYSSPHLIDYRERVRINDRNPPAEQFCAAFAAVEAVRADISLTYFEFGTLAALWMMQQQPLDVIVLEVGLGGRLDATNIVDADIAVLTTIDLDHQEWLGNTRDKIATEKAGIMRQGGIAVIGEPEPPPALLTAVADKAVNAWWQGVEFGYSQDNARWQWHSPTLQLDDLPIPSIPLQNASTALATLARLDALPDTAVIREVLSVVSLVGRRQRIAAQPDCYVDVGHNPQAARGLLAWLEQQQFSRLHLVVGMLKDKAITDTLQTLQTVDAQWYLASTHGPRGCPAEQLARSVSAWTAQYACFDKVTPAYQQAKHNATAQDMILVFGSFHTVADVLALEQAITQ